MSKPDLNRFYPLNVAVLTVSHSRRCDNDSSCDLLSDILVQTGCKLAIRSLLPNNKYTQRALLSHRIARSNIQVILINSGTGYAKGYSIISAYILDMQQFILPLINIQTGSSNFVTEVKNSPSKSCGG